MGALTDAPRQSSYDYERIARNQPFVEKAII